MEIHRADYQETLLAIGELEKEIDEHGLNTDRARRLKTLKGKLKGIKLNMKIRENPTFGVRISVEKIDGEIEQ